MALHTQLQIYGTGYELLGHVVELVRHMPREYKPALGRPVLDDCRAVMDMIRRANIARDKAPHLARLGEHVAATELLLRLSVDKRLISRRQYAKAIGLTQSIGRQATAWRKKCAPSPAV